MLFILFFIYFFILFYFIPQGCSPVSTQPHLPLLLLFSLAMAVDEFQDKNLIFKKLKSKSENKVFNTTQNTLITSLTIISLFLSPYFYHFFLQCILFLHFGMLTTGHKLTSSVRSEDLFLISDLLVETMISILCAIHGVYDGNVSLLN